jgi:hypothetical protein
LPNFGFNPQQHKLSAAMEQMAAGWYPAVIESSDIVPTSAKNGFRLVLTFLIIDGPGKGRKVTKGYNIDNPSAQSVEIAMSEIATICACIGRYQPIQQTEELHHQPLQIRLTCPKDSDFNDVKGYRTINGDDPAKGGTTPVAQVAQQGYAQQPPQQAAAYPQHTPVYQHPQPPQTPMQSAPGTPPAPAWQQPQQGTPAQPPAWTPPAPPSPPAPPAPPNPTPAYGQPQQPPQTPPQAPAWTPGALPPAPPAWAQPQS